MEIEADKTLSVAERRIAWVLGHPHTSEWLKRALGSALARDPVSARNDVEILRHLIVMRTGAQVECTIASREDGAA